jgi:hypothetical protein
VNSDADREVAEIVDGMAAQERRVLELIVPNRHQAAPIVAAAGLQMAHFGQEDHRLIFAGWQLACESNLSLVSQLSLARRALMAAGYWDPSALALAGSPTRSSRTSRAMGPATGLSAQSRDT